MKICARARKSIRRFRTIIGAAAITLALASAVSASVIAEDPFHYTVGTNNLQGQGGGIGWATNWTAPGNSSDKVDVADTTSSPLTFTPVGGAAIGGDTTGGQAYGPANAPVAARQLSVPLTNTFYVSYLVRYDNTNVPPENHFNRYNTFSLFLSDTARNTGALNFGLRSTGDLTTFMAREGTGDPHDGASITHDFLAGVNHLMVAKVTCEDGKFDHIDCWLDPACASSNAPAVTLSEGHLEAVNYIFFRAAKGEPDDRYTFGHVVIGTEWNDVVPLKQAQ